MLFHLNLDNISSGGTTIQEDFSQFTIGSKILSTNVIKIKMSSYLLLDDELRTGDLPRERDLDLTGERERDLRDPDLERERRPRERDLEYERDL